MCGSYSTTGSSICVQLNDVHDIKKCRESNNCMINGGVAIPSISYHLCLETEENERYLHKTSRCTNITSK